MIIDPEKLSGELIDGRYRLVKHIATGGQGSVYVADIEEGGSVVGEAAVKLGRPTHSNPTPLRRELEAMEVLSHPRLVAKRGHGEVCEGLAQGCKYLAMDLAETTLEERQKRSTLIVDELLEPIHHLAEALQYLHLHNAVHGDVKPGNLFKMRDGWQLGDFGLLRFLSAPASGSVGANLRIETRSNQKGTVLYIAPEFIETGLHAPSCDIWALGVVAQQCLTHRFPYEPTSDINPEAQIISAHFMRGPYIAPDLPEPFGALVRGCLIKDPAGRMTLPQILDLLRGATRQHVAVASHTPQPTEQGSESSESFSRPRARKVAQIEQHRGWVQAVALSPDGQFLASGGSDGIVNVWQTSALKDDSYIEPEAALDHVAPVSFVAFSSTAQGAALASASWNGKVAMRPPASPIPEWYDGGYAIDCATFAPDGHTLIVGLRDGRILTLRTRLSPFFELKSNGWRGPMTGIAVSSDTQLVAVGSRRGLHVAHMNGSRQSVYYRERVARAPVWLGGHQVLFGRDRELVTLNVDTGEESVLQGHTDTVLAVATSGNLIASGGRDKTIRLWNLERRQLLAKLDGHDGSVRALSFSADGQWLASGCTEGIVLLWEIS